MTRQQIFAETKVEIVKTPWKDKKQRNIVFVYSNCSAVLENEVQSHGHL